MTLAAIIVAAGRGTRLGGDTPKQWRRLGRKTVLEYALDAIAPHVDRTIVVLHPDDHARWSALKIAGVVTVEGGATRDASVHAGLEALAADQPAKVLIHDAARPFTPAKVIEDVLNALESAPAAAPALAVTDALWRGSDGTVVDTVIRDGLHRAQTPQGFRFDAILAAHRDRQQSAADDVEIARDAGHDVRIVDGSEHNFKITTAADLERAEEMMAKTMDVRTGNGFDVHRFGAGDHVWLCGVRISYDRGLQGHSDADVGMHAITDAIYGALGQGDIGQHFPPSDPQWKGAASHIFLEHAVALADEAALKLSNIDCTLICEFPKIGPHQAAMKSALSAITGLAPDRISVKATTSERLGFTGRGEGIASIATVTLVSV